MANYPALPNEFRLAVSWLEQQGNEVRVKKYDKALNELLIEQRSDRRGAAFIPYVLSEHEDLIFMRLVGKLGVGVPVRNKVQGIKESDSTMKRMVRRHKHQRKIAYRVEERVPPTGDAMDLWKERSDLLKRLHDAEDAFLKNPDDLRFAICKALREEINTVEDTLVAEHENG